MSSIIWHGPTECNFCNINCTSEIFSAKTIYGCWANMCSNCFDIHTLKELGTGQGQRYERTPSGENFVKIEG